MKPSDHNENLINYYKLVISIHAGKSYMYALFEKYKIFT